jgi:hypothetical protein
VGMFDISTKARLGRQTTAIAKIVEDALAAPSTSVFVSKLVNSASSEEARELSRRLAKVAILYLDTSAPSAGRPCIQLRLPIRMSCTLKPDALMILKSSTRRIRSGSNQWLLGPLLLPILLSLLKVSPEPATSKLLPSGNLVANAGKPLPPRTCRLAQETTFAKKVPHLRRRLPMQRKRVQAAKD